jgi:hypothetical protein
MRVGSVPQLHPLNSNRALLLPSQAGVLLPEVVSNRAIVLRSRLERLQSKSPLGLLADLSILLPLGDDGVIVGRGGENGDSGVVLRGGSEEGDASDVDLLDGTGEGAVGLGDLLDEGVEVADDEGDGGDLVGSKVGEVGLDLSGENT